MLSIAALLVLAPTPAVPPAADPALAALRAEADAVIRRAAAEGEFVNDTRKDFPAVRHEASGMRCLFQPGRGDNAIVRTGASAGVSCVSRPVGFRQTLEAAPLPGSGTLDSVFEASVAELTAGRPDARPHRSAGFAVRVEPSSGPAPAEPRTAAFLLTRDGEAVFSRVSVAVVDGWIIRQRFEAPAAQADEAELLAGVVMSTTLIDLASRPAG